MADAGFFKGTSAEQDSRFANKQKKLLQQMKFPDNINVKIDMIKVNLDVMKSWITKRLQELLGIEDDVVIEFVFNQLEDKHPDPKMMQINLTGFLGGSKARLFIGELWKFLASAQSSLDGIPIELVELKKKEILKKQENDDRLKEIRKREEESQKQIVKVESEKFENRRRSVEKTRPKPRPQPEKQIVRSSSESENDRRHISRKQRTYSSASSSSSSKDEKVQRKKEKINNVSDEKINKEKKPKRTRSVSVSSASSSMSEVEVEKPKKKVQSTRRRSRSRSSSNHRHKKSRKHEKYSSRKHHHESKRRDHRNESKQTKNRRHDSTRKKYSKSPENNIRQRSPSSKKPRLESQIRVQTPPPPPPTASQESPVKTSNRDERIVVLEESRIDRPTSLSSRVSVVNKTNSHDESSEVHHSSEDENEIDLRERLLREKAIKSMKRRQSSSNNPPPSFSNDKSSKPPIAERIVYQTQ